MSRVLIIIALLIVFNGAFHDETMPGRTFLMAFSVLTVGAILGSFMFAPNK